MSRSRGAALGEAALSLALAAGLWWIPGAARQAPGAALPAAQVELLWKEAAVARDDKRLDASLSAIERLAASFPHEPRYLSFQADVLERLGRFRDAAKTWEKFIESAPFPTEACPRIGRDYEKAGLAERGLDAHRRCLAMDPSKSDLLLYLALALERAGQGDEAEIFLRRTLERSPQYADAGAALARARLRHADVAGAEAALRPFLTDKTENADVLLSGALIARAKGERERARALLKRAIQISPGYTDLYRVLASVEQ